MVGNFPLYFVITNVGRLINQTAILARLFYLTARLLMCKTHPFESEYSPEMRNLQRSHAHDICGIIAHIKDRYVNLTKASNETKLTIPPSGISSLSIRFLTFAAGFLTTREAQEQALEILNRLLRETGWQADPIKQELQETWGWTTHQQILTSADTPSLMDEHHSVLDPRLRYSTHAAQPKMPSGVIDPTMITADFAVENHPYRDFYIPPQHSIEDFQFGVF